MKIVALIGGDAAPLTYFTNEIHRHFPLDLVVVERPKSRPAAAPNVSKAAVSFPEKVVNYLKFRMDMRRQQQRKAQEKQALAAYQEELFGGTHHTLAPDLKVLHVDSINSPEAEEAIKQVGPDLLLDHGTSLVKDHIIDLAQLALNLHWGLSPYYRGVMCTNQALLNWDIHNIGVTVHKLAKRIDGGDVLGQKRLEITPDDTIGRITSRLSYHGTAIVVKALEKYQNGDALRYSEQDFTQGFITRSINWNPHLNHFVEELNKELLAKMIKRPSRGPAPIVELI